MSAFRRTIFYGTADLYITGGDGKVYLRRRWVPGELDLWQRLDTAEFDIALDSQLSVVGSHIVARSQQGDLLICDSVPAAVLFGGGWQTLDSPGFLVRAIAAGGSDDQLRCAVRPVR